jgi:hypothetical protein
MFIAGRGGGLTLQDSVPPVSTWRRSIMPSVAVANWSLKELQHYVSEAIASKTWAILQFHGVGGGHHMNCPLPVFLEFVAWLESEYSHRVITVVEGARRLWSATTNTFPVVHDGV